MKLDLSFGTGTKVVKDTSVADLIAKADSLLHVEHVRPNRKLICIEPIMPNDYKMQDVIMHFYNEIPPSTLELPDSVSVVVHGHERGRSCHTPFFCHIYGYRPTGAEHPGFISLFRQKWSYIEHSK